MSFSITLPDSSKTDSTNTSPGSPTSAMLFNVSTNDATDVEAAVSGTSAKQTPSTPFFLFKNTGNVPLDWMVKLESAFPSMFKLKGSTAYAGAKTEITTDWWVIDTNITLAGNSSAWFWGNFTNAYPSNSTSRNLSHKSNISS